MKFNSHNDVVVALAVDTVNLLTPGWRHGKPHQSPTGAERRAAIAAAVPEEQDPGVGPTESEAAALVEVAESLRTVFVSVDAGDVDAAAAVLNRLLQESDSRPHLSKHDDQPWHIHFHGRTDDYVDNWAAGCATALAVVVGSRLHGRLGVCAAECCDRVYMDTSRNGKRRFCSTLCQNRVKTAAFRARGAGGATSGRPSENTGSQ